MSAEKYDKKKIKVGIRTKLICGFMFFTLVIGVLLWVLETAFLDSFHTVIKEQELKNTANYVSEYLYNEELYDKAINKVKSTNIDVLITDNRGNTKLEIIQLGSKGFGMFNRELRLKIYNDTLSNGGEKFTSFIRGENKVEINPDFEFEGSKNNFRFPTFINLIQQDSMIFTKIVNEGTKDARMLILITDIAPLESTVEVLKFQLIWVSIIMVVLSLLLSLVLSRTISKPIVSINKNAAKLAKGDYSVNFENSSTKEIDELASTLSYASKELGKVDGFRKELIANVSHDLRTPLTMIKGYSEVMRDIPGENTPENMQIIIDETERLNLLVNDLLDISKLESGKMNLNKEKFSLTKLIKDILERFAKLSDYNISFEYESEAFVFADKLKITQVVYNLMGNAITYTGEDKCIFITQEIIGNTVKISVRDTGDGIDQKNLPYIWDRYYKIYKTHRRASVGTGLGLSIVKQILELHGGKYGVISKVNEGSTFHFTLDLSSDIL